MVMLFLHIIQLPKYSSERIQDERCCDHSGGIMGLS